MQDCHFFSLADLPRALRRDPFIRSKAKLCFPLSSQTKPSRPVPALAAACVCVCSGPWQLLVSDNLLSSSSAHVCNVNDCFDDLHVFFQCVSVELKRYTIFNKKLQASGLMEKSTHSFPLPCTNISRAAGEFVYTNKLRAAS